MKHQAVHSWFFANSCSPYYLILCNTSLPWSECSHCIIVSYYLYYYTLLGFFIISIKLFKLAYELGLTTPVIYSTWFKKGIDLQLTASTSSPGIRAQSLWCPDETALAAWTGPNPLLWLRFLDDILMLWSGDQDQLQAFLTHLNQQMTHINFTMTSSQQSTTFLDLEIYKSHRFRRSSTLDTKLFIKPTNPQTFLHYNSCHPASTFSTIVKGELLRALRATSDVETYSITVAKLMERFLQRGYPKEFFLGVADTVTFGDRADLLTPHPRQTLPQNTTIFSIRHHPALPSADIWQALTDEEVPFDPMIVRPRPPSHRDLLVRAKTPGRERHPRRTDPPQPSGSSPPTDFGAPPT